MLRDRHSSGFTLIEILVTIAIIGTLAAIAIPIYLSSTVKASATEFIVKHEELQTIVESLGQNMDACTDVIHTISPAILKSKYAALDVGFEAVQGGYTPIFRICAEAATHGNFGIRVSKMAFTTFSERGLVSPGNNVVLGESMVVYSVPIAPGKPAVCNEFTMITAPGGTGCGGAGGLTPALSPPMPSIQPALAPPKPSAPLAPTPMQIKVPKIQAYVMKFSGTDTYVRPTGETLNTNGPLNAFTVEMSFIGDPNTASASGGTGPVMFNYGDSSNAHNAISLWNPKSLTVALLGQNLDTGVNVADGQTHRISVSWDGTTGRLAVLDNGRVAKEWANIHQGESIPGDGHMVIAHKSTGGGNYNPNEAFSGQIFNTAVARQAVADTDLAKPLNQMVNTGSGLLADFKAMGGRIVDATGRHTVETGGVTPTLTGVEGNLIH